MTNRNLTQHYSTWGDKLLQHCTELGMLQVQKTFRPITVQVAPTEACDSDCPFCSVGNRPSGKIPWQHIQWGLASFSALGAKSVELTGGGNPLLYRDGEHKISDVVLLARQHGMKVGIITNSEAPLGLLSREAADACDWIRVSLAKLDEGKNANAYDFNGLDGKVALSYIFHARSRPDILQEIRRLLDRWPTIKFVRLAPDCTTDDALTIEERLGAEVRAIDPDGKCFIKDIGDNYHPYPHGCWVGGLRPYWTSTGIYICTSHVLKTRKYEPEWLLCEHVRDIIMTWVRMHDRLAAGKPPYDIDISKCWHCYYYNNNALLHKVVTPLPDKDFA